MSGPMYPTSVGVIDKQIMTGQNALLYAGDYPVANVNTWDLRQTFKNQQWTPAASGMELTIPSGGAYTLTMKETLISNFDLWAQYVGQYQLNHNSAATQYNTAAGLPDRPFFIPLTLTGEATDAFGNVMSIYMYNLIPDGDLSILSSEPEKILERDWTFKLNSPPHINKLWEPWNEAPATPAESTNF